MLKRFSLLSGALPGAVIVALISSGALFELCAQTPTSSIVGTIRDTSRAVIPGVQVSVTETGRGYQRTTVTDDQGNYEIGQLLEGVYTVEAELPGFKKFIQQQAPLKARSALRIDITLEVGEVTESVIVTGKAPAVESESGLLSAVGGTKEFLKDIPKNELIIYGVHAFHFSAHWYGFKPPSAHSLQQRTTLDGMDVARNHEVQNYDIQEFKLQYSGAKAEATAPALVDFVLRGGSNQFHGLGTVEAFYPSLGAIGPFPGSPRPHGPTSTIKYWQGSGPVYIPKVYDGRDKTFFFVSREWETYTETGQSWSTIRVSSPPLAWREGDFSTVASRNFTNAQKALVNPFTGQVFPGNIISSSLINPTGARIQNLFHLPNNVPAGDRTTFFENYKVDFNEGFGGTRDSGRWLFKFDHQLTENDTIGFTHHRNPFFQTFDQTVQKHFYELIDRTSNNYYGYWTHVFSPSVVNEFRAGIQRFDGFFGLDPNPPVKQSMPSNGFDQLKAFGITWAPEKVDPLARQTSVGLCIDGIYLAPTCGRPAFSGTFYDQRHLLNNLSLTRGVHTFKLGFDYRPNYNFTNSAPTGLFGKFSFTGRFTGFPYGDFLLGLPDTSERGGMTPRPYRIQNWFSTYFQDDWKVSPRLTLELGLRLEHLSRSHEKNGMMVTFDPATGSLVVPNQDSLKLVSPLFPSNIIPVKTAAQVGFPERLRDRPQATFYPRFGFAFRPVADARTVVRGGWGLFLVPSTVAGDSLYQTAPFALSETFRNDIVSGQPLFSFPFGFPTAPGRIPGQNAFGVAREFPFGYSQNWNLTVEREIMNDTAVRVSYIGSKITQMPYTRNINKPRPSLLPFDSNCAAKPAGTCVGPVFRHFGAVTLAEAGGNQHYHGLELELKRRWSQGLSFVVDYSFSKGISDVDSAGFFDSGDYGNEIENPYDRRRDRARNYASVPHRLLIMKTWEIPLGRSRRFLSDTSGIGGKILDTIVGGWIFTSRWAYTGRTVATPLWGGADTSHTGTPNARADLVSGCNPSLDKPTAAQMYNRSCFARSAEGRFGNAGRNSVWGPANAGENGNILTPNFGVYKYTTITPRAKWAENGLRLRIGFKFRNAFNHPSLNPIAGAGVFTGPLLVNSVASERGTIGGSRRIYVDMGLEF